MPICYDVVHSMKRFAGVSRLCSEFGTELTTIFIRSVAQPGSAPALGAGGPWFESLYSDQERSS